MPVLIWRCTALIRYLHSSNSVNGAISSTGGTTDGQIQAVVLSLLNTVSCQNATKSYCLGLKRNSCQRTLNTCGECLTGYIGDLGDHNSPCILKPNFAKMQVFKKIIRLAVVPCSTSANCSTFAMCVKGSCQIPLKNCIDSCSGRGLCSFISTNTGKGLSTCYVGDPQCYPMCTCNTGFFGLSCKENAATFAGHQELKFVLITGLYNLTESQDENLNTVLGWATTAASLSQNYAELTTTSLKVLTKIIKTVLTVASELAIPYNQVSLSFTLIFHHQSSSSVLTSSILSQYFILFLS